MIQAAVQMPKRSVAVLFAWYRHGAGLAKLGMQAHGWYALRTLLGRTYPDTSKLHARWDFHDRLSDDGIVRNLKYWKKPENGKLRRPVVYATDSAGALLPDGVRQQVGL